MSGRTADDCPFCSATLVTVMLGERGGVPVARVMCVACGAEGPEGAGMAAAVQGWNTRLGRGAPADFVALEAAPS